MAQPGIATIVRLPTKLVYDGKKRFNRLSGNMDDLFTENYPGHEAAVIESSAGGMIVSAYHPTPNNPYMSSFGYFLGFVGGIKNAHKRDDGNFNATDNYYPVWSTLTPKDVNLEIGNVTVGSGIVGGRPSTWFAILGSRQVRLVACPNNNHQGVVMANWFNWTGAYANPYESWRTAPQALGGQIQIAPILPGRRIKLPTWRGDESDWTKGWVRGAEMAVMLGLSAGGSKTRAFGGTIGIHHATHYRLQEAQETVGHYVGDLMGADISDEPNTTGGVINSFFERRIVPAGSSRAIRWYRRKGNVDTIKVGEYGRWVVKDRKASYEPADDETEVRWTMRSHHNGPPMLMHVESGSGLCWVRDSVTGHNTFYIGPHKIAHFPSELDIPGCVGMRIGAWADGAKYFCHAVSGSNGKVTPWVWGQVMLDDGEHEWTDAWITGDLGRGAGQQGALEPVYTRKHW